MTRSPSDFRDMVVKRRDACVKFKDGRASRDRRDALQFYRGDNLTLYGESGDGLSSVVSRDTMEAIESMLPSLVKPFVAGEEVVRFEPVGPEDEDGAKQATDYINHVFTTHNNAFRVIYDAMKDGLLYRLGVAKTVVETEDDGAPEVYADLDEGQLQAIQAAAQQEKRELVGDIAQDPATGLYTVTIAPKKATRYRVYVIAPNEFLYEERLASMEAGTFFGHSKTATVGDLIAMGLPADKCRALKSGDAPDDEARDRFQDEDRWSGSDWNMDDLARPVVVDELYIRCDYEGTGTLAWRKVVLGGQDKSMLLDESADDHPYSSWTPIPVPHKLVGHSIADLTRDIQMQKTALQREILNNSYLVNRPQRQVLEGQVNLDDLLNPAVGGVVRVKQLDAMRAIETPFVAGQMFPLIEYLDGTREARTGVTRYNQGMDTNSLNHTATGVSIIANASQQRQELVARQFAEFMKDVFRKMLGLVSRHGDKAETIRLRGQWVQVDPTDWKNSYDTTVTVGLGTNNRSEMVGHLMNLLTLDQQIITLQQGLRGPLVTAENVHEKLKRLIEAMGLKGVDSYYTDPAAQSQQPPTQPQEPPVDPLAGDKIKAQTELHKADIKAHSDVAVAAIRHGIASPPAPAWAPEPTPVMADPVDAMPAQ